MPREFFSAVAPAGHNASFPSLHQHPEHQAPSSIRRRTTVREHVPKAPLSSPSLLPCSGLLDAMCALAGEKTALRSETCPARLDATMDASHPVGCVLIGLVHAPRDGRLPLPVCSRCSSTAPAPWLSRLAKGGEASLFPRFPRVWFSRGAGCGPGYQICCLSTIRAY